MPSRVLCTYLYMIGKQRLKSKQSAVEILRISRVDSSVRVRDKNGTHGKLNP
jgi:hypothetical protein